MLHSQQKEGEHIMSNYNKNPTGRLTDADIDPLSGVELAVDDLTFVKRGKSASEMFAGFTPTPEQLEAMNSGITSEDVDQIGTNETNITSLQTLTQGIDSTGNNFIEINGVKLYFGSTAPTDPSDGDWWLN